MTHDHDPIGTDLGHRVSAATPANVPVFGEVLERRRRRRARRAVLGAGLATAIVVAGTTAAVGLREDAAGPAPTATSTPPADETPEVPPATDPPTPDVPVVEPGDAPPEPVLLVDGEQRPLTVWTTCWTSGGGAYCADGMPVQPYVSAGDPVTVPIGFPLEGWSFTATAVRLSTATGEPDGCTRRFDLPVTKTSPTTFLVGPARPEGRYRVDLFGRGPQGDVSASFSWGSSGGDFPEASGYVGVLSDSGGDLTSYGVELGLRDLDRGYPDASAVVTLTNRDGDSRTYGPYRQSRRDARCDDGTVFIASDFDAAADAPELGRGPIDYRVELVLDATTYVGTAVWPRDERKDEAPYADLVWDPPLPSYAG